MQKCISWDTASETTDRAFDDRDPDQQVRSSIPGALYIFSSLALLLVTQFMRNGGVVVLPPS